MSNSIDTSNTTLSIKREAFCQEYIVDRNAHKAAIRAGYSDNSARVTSSRIMADENVQKRLRELEAEIIERNKITIDELVETLSYQVRFDIAELYDENGKLKNIHDIPKEIRNSITELTVDEIIVGKEVIGQAVKVKISNRNDSIDKLMKHLGGYEKDNGQKVKEEKTIIALPDGTEITL